MNKKLINCNPSICLCGSKNTPNELMTEEGVFISKEIYKTLCENTCPNKQVCGSVIDKLQLLKLDEAFDLSKNIKHDKK